MRLLDRLFRQLYRTVWPLLGFIRRFYSADGVSIAVWLADGRLLIVEHSYKEGTWCPGGGVRSGEAPSEAAIRELGEETGEAVAQAANRAEPRLVSTYCYRENRGSVYFFEVVLDHEPRLMIDNREIIYAAFLTPHQIIRRGVGKRFAAYLRARSERTEVDAVQLD